MAAFVSNIKFYFQPTERYVICDNSFVAKPQAGTFRFADVYIGVTVLAQRQFRRRV